MENTIVPQLLSEIDGVEGLENVIVIGASNREDMIDPAILRPGRLDVKIKIERPDAEAAKDIFSKYLTSNLPLHADDVAEHGGNVEAACAAMIQSVVEQMYAESEENRFLEVTYANGDKEVLYFKDFNSGAMIENIVGRAKKMAIKAYLDHNQKGLRVSHLLSACVDEFKENEDLPNTTNPDDWARISGKKGEGSGSSTSAPSSPASRARTPAGPSTPSPTPVSTCSGIRFRLRVPARGTRSRIVSRSAEEVRRVISPLLSVRHRLSPPPRRAVRRRGPHTGRMRSGT